MAAPSNRFLGKFRGRVMDNNDPLHLGRVTVEVPDVLGDEPSTWALPCLPFTGPEAGQFVVPSRGTGVWVEFEQGDPSFPIWTGCWYGDEKELPPDAKKLVETPSDFKPVVVQTPGAHKIVMSDAPGDERGSSCRPTAARTSTSPGKGSPSRRARARRSSWKASE